jgi:hypothetical protein
MDLDFGTFALRQMLNSLVVIGPLLMITGLSFYLFRESRRSTYIYLLTGTACTIIGAVCLIGEFKRENSVHDYRDLQIEKVEAARK